MVFNGILLYIFQARVRECLVNLLTACGQRVGLPKSPSVRYIFDSLIYFSDFSFVEFLVVCFHNLPFIIINIIYYFY